MTYYNLCGIKSKHSNISKGREGGTYNNSQVCKSPIVKVDRNKYLTWNRCPLSNCELKKTQNKSDQTVLILLLYSILP